MAGSAHSTVCPAANLLLDFSRDGANVKSWAGLGWAGLGWAGLGWAGLAGLAGLY